MNDTEAIEWLICERENYSKDSVYRYYMGLAVKALEKQLNGGWIPASSKGLPEERGFYIFQLKNNKIHEWYYANETLYNDFDNGEPIYNVAFDINEILAWMPLPEAYKEVE